jgi:hypothetical protein
MLSDLAERIRISLAIVKQGCRTGDRGGQLVTAGGFRIVAFVAQFPLSAIELTHSYLSRCACRGPPHLRVIRLSRHPFFAASFP